MQLTGTQLIARSQEAVWAALNDPETLRACLPGCESLERVSDTEYRAQIVAAVGPVKSKFSGKLQLSDIDAPRSYQMTFEGSGGAAGTARGGAQVSLASEGTATRLSYTANAQVGGKLAQVGSRLIDGVAKKMADEFFARFGERVAAPVPEPAIASAPPQLEPRSRVHAGWIVAVTLALVLIALWASV